MGRGLDGVRDRGLAGVGLLGVRDGGVRLAGVGDGHGGGGVGGAGVGDVAVAGADAGVGGVAGVVRGRRVGRVAGARVVARVRRVADVVGRRRLVVLGLGVVLLLVPLVVVLVVLVLLVVLLVILVVVLLLLVVVLVVMLLVMVLVVVVLVLVVHLGTSEHAVVTLIMPVLVGFLVLIDPVAIVMPVVSTLALVLVRDLAVAAPLCQVDPDVDRLAVKRPGVLVVEGGVNLSVGDLAEPGTALVEPVVGPAQVAVLDGERVRYHVRRQRPGKGHIDEVRVGGEEVAVARELALLQGEGDRLAAVGRVGVAAVADEAVAALRWRVRDAFRCAEFTGWLSSVDIVEGAARGNYRQQDSVPWNVVQSVIFFLSVFWSGLRMRRTLSTVRTVGTRGAGWTRRRIGLGGY